MQVFSLWWLVLPFRERNNAWEIQTTGRAHKDVTDRSKTLQVFFVFFFSLMFVVVRVLTVKLSELNVRNIRP